MRMWCLSAGVLLSAAAILVRTPAVAAVEADPLLPAETQVVAVVHWHQLLAATLFQKQLGTCVAESLPRSGELSGLCKTLGVDPAKDVDHLILAAPLTLESDKVVLIARGRFNPDRIAKAAAKFIEKSPDVLKLHRDGDRRLYEFREPKKNVPSLFFAVVNEWTVVASAGRETVIDALARSTGKKQPGVSKELQAVLDRVDDQATIWVAGLVSAELKKRLAPAPEYRKLVDSLQSFRGAVRVAEGVKAEFLIQTNDARAAVEIRKFMEGVKSILILAATSQDPRNGTVWADLLSALKVANSGDVVTLKGQVTADQVEKSVKDRKK